MGVTLLQITRLSCVIGVCTSVGLIALHAFSVDAAPVVLVLSNALIGLGAVLLFHYTSVPHAALGPEPSHLHWDLTIERRGMGDLIRSINHIAIIVSDVGRSLAFYTEIIGFQQIQRPNFDRHGAWLTMGNLELHLIKGVPNAPSGRDLIVSHMALETEEPHKVLEKLLEYEVPFRQNISVPDPTKARENLVEAFENSDGKVTQYFIRDPDGYYLEICNCDILTAFCLFKEKEAQAQKKFGHIPKYMKLMDALLTTYNESGQIKASPFRLPQLFKTAWRVQQLVRRARAELRKSTQERVERALEGVQAAQEPDQELLEKFIGRQKTYCDVCQGFSQEDLAAALCKSGNHAPTALLLLSTCRQEVRVLLPPQYLLSEGGRIKQQVMAVSAPKRKSFGSFRMFASKPFEDTAVGERGGMRSDSNRRSPAARMGTCGSGGSDSFMHNDTSRRSRTGSFNSTPVGKKSGGAMLALRFEEDAKMQSYLQKNYSLCRRQVQVNEESMLESTDGWQLRHV